MEYKIFADEKDNVWKYVFNFDGAVAEAVLYRYPDFQTRTVLCISVSSGCKIGCKFCGSGKKFIRHLTSSEIALQVLTIFNELRDKWVIDNINSECAKLQIMFMSMGEPFLNYTNVKSAIQWLNEMYPNAQLLISTIAPDKQEELGDFIQLSKSIDKIGLQFSIHASYDRKRNELIPYKNKLSLNQIRDYGIEWWKETGRKPYLNYCVDIPLDEHTYADLTNRFPPNVFCLTFSVICPIDKSLPVCKNVYIENWQTAFRNAGYDVRVFDPNGQDTIGAGCGQLFVTQRIFNGESWEEATNES